MDIVHFDGIAFNIFAFDVSSLNPLNEPVRFEILACKLQAWMWKQSKRYAGWHKTGERESRAVDRIANILFKYHIYYTIRQNMEVNGAKALRT